MARKKIKGTNYRPRLCVFRSNKHVYAQIIDDDSKITITASSTVDKVIREKVRSTNGCMAADVVGQDIGKKSKKRGISKLVFDRKNRIYHGRIKSLVEGIKKEGIEF